MLISSKVKTWATTKQKQQNLEKQNFSGLQKKKKKDIQLKDEVPLLIYCFPQSLLK